MYFTSRQNYAIWRRVIIFGQNVSWFEEERVRVRVFQPQFTTEKLIQNKFVIKIIKSVTNKINNKNKNTIQ